MKVPICLVFGLSTLCHASIGLVEAQKDEAASFLWNRHVTVTMGPKPLVITCTRPELSVIYDGTQWFDGEGNPIFAIEAKRNLKLMGFRRDPTHVMNVGDCSGQCTFDFNGNGIGLDWDKKFAGEYSVLLTKQ